MRYHDETHCAVGRLNGRTSQFDDETSLQDESDCAVAHDCEKAVKADAAETVDFDFNEASVESVTVPDDVFVEVSVTDIEQAGSPIAPLADVEQVASPITDVEEAASSIANVEQVASPIADMAVVNLPLPAQRNLGDCLLAAVEERGDLSPSAPGAHATWATALAETEESF